METNLFDRVDKKVLASPLNYTGSKYKLIPILSEYIPSDIDEIYDLFCGGGSFFINYCLSNKVYANDIILPLIEFYIFMQKNTWLDVLDAIQKKQINRNQTEYLLLRERFNKENNPIDLFLLCCSCTNNMMRFNKSLSFNQTWGNRIFNRSIEKKLYDYHKRIYNNNNLVFINNSFENINIENKRAFVYLDPPYMITDAGYNCYWSKSLELKLYDYIDSLNSNGIRFLMSNVMQHKGKKNPYCDRIKKYDIVKIECDYDKVSRSGNSKSEEIIIKNY